MKVLISLESGLSDSAASAAAGELTITGDMLDLSWTEPPQGEDKSVSVHRLSYQRQADILHIERTGDNASDLSFSPTARTQGLLSTPYGDFAMDIETKLLLVPEELWHFSDEAAEVFTRKQMCESIQLSYFLHINGQEPMPNDITIQITLEKNRK